MLGWIGRCPTARWALWPVALALAGNAGPVAAQAISSKPAGIYSCTDDKGRRLTADRPIPECVGRDQHVLNQDGSLRTVLPPTPTAEERAEREARERIAADQRAAQADAVRRDRNLMTRYPNEAAHARAREAAIDTVKIAMKSTEVRLLELAAERKPLREEAEFYQGKPLPTKLKTALDANDAAVDAQRSAQSNQESELGRITKLYDNELDRLRKLWAGAPAGSLGVLVPAPTTARMPLPVGAKAGAAPPR